ncbi:DNA-3-methyladenine glycosylase I [Desulfocurvus sp. DL9XJH121]
MRTRCPWARHELEIAYHDTEWGAPEHDDARLFEFLILEGAQAGLSWLTILKRREGYRAALDGFDAEAVARYDERRLAELARDARIIRNRLKIASTVQNARAFLAARDRYGSFDAYVWRFADGAPRVNAWRTSQDVPASTPEAEAMSKALKKDGFTFVGPTICYAFMQAVGMVNDHLVDCFRHAELS